MGTVVPAVAGSRTKKAWDRWHGPEGDLIAAYPHTYTAVCALYDARYPEIVSEVTHPFMRALRREMKVHDKTCGIFTSVGQTETPSRMELLCFFSAVEDEAEEKLGDLEARLKNLAIPPRHPQAQQAVHTVSKGVSIIRGVEKLSDRAEGALVSYLLQQVAQLEAEPKRNYDEEARLSNALEEWQDAVDVQRDQYEVQLKSKTDETGRLQEELKNQKRVAKDALRAQAKAEKARDDAIGREHAINQQSAARATENNTLQSQLDTATKLQQTTDKTLEDTKTALERMKGQVEDKQSELDDVESQMTSLEDDVSDLRDSKQTIVNNLDAALRRLEAKESELTSERQKSQKLVLEGAGEQRELVSKITGQHNEAVRLLRAQQDQLLSAAESGRASDKKHHDATVRASREEIDGLRQIEEAVKQQHGRDLETLRDKHQKDISAWTENQNLLRDRLQSTYESQLTEVRNMKDEVVRLEREKRQQVAKDARLTEDKVIKLEVEVESLRGDVNRGDVQIHDIKQQRDALQKEQVNRQKTHERLQSELLGGAERLSEAREAAREAIAAKLANENRLRDQERAINQHGREVADLQEAVHAAQENAKRLVGLELDKVDKAAAEHERDLKDARDEARKDIEGLRQELRDERSQAAERLKSETEELCGELKGMRDERDGLSVELGNVRGESNARQQAVNRITLERDGLRTRGERLQEQINAVDKSNESLKTFGRENIDFYNKIEKRLDKAQEELGFAQERIVALTKEVSTTTGAKETYERLYDGERRAHDTTKDNLSAGLHREEDLSNQREADQHAAEEREIQFVRQANDHCFALNGQIRTAEEQITTLNNRLDAVVVDRDLHKDLYDLMSNDLEKEKTRYQAGRRENVLLDLEIARVSGQRDFLERRVGEILQKRTDPLHVEIKQLQNQKIVLQKEHDEAVEETNQAHDQVVEKLGAQHLQAMQVLQKKDVAYQKLIFKMGRDLNEATEVIEEMMG
ncbi:uncharacterized protein LTR77_003335 [Saxophila tyrrhenica]|uniref:Uncharacterized protein n=1 Tax=Saxophila tyrrhenica TaxID=1690608 RepID=A0AAV9PLX1_9PEZI|nr:hypothetical protein LTR77_003335 [Saxophila tyrrhenica]